jgi:tetratricopeptide (TPR) repeat protein
VWVFGLSLAHPKERVFQEAVATEVIASSGSPQKSPDPDTFQQSLRVYRTGRAQDAISQLAAWPVDRLVAAAKASAPNLSSSDRMAAAILQAEVASALLDAHRVHYGLASRVSPNDGRKVTEVVNSGLALFYDAGRAPFGEQLGDEPRRWWYYAVASSLVASILLPEASQVIDIGLKEFHDDPLLLTARGTIAGRFHHGPKVAMMRLPSTKAAMADYKRALMLAPGLTIAKLRLGHLYVDLGAGPEATGWLQSVAAGASTDDQQYVAHLLLGRVAARAQDLEVADAEYRKAYGIGAGYQAACIALSRNEEVLDHPERAADLARDCLLLSGHDDPWPYYDAMGDPDALLHLRAEVRGR